MSSCFSKEKSMKSHLLPASHLPSSTKPTPSTTIHFLWAQFAIWVFPLQLPQWKGQKTLIVLKQELVQKHKCFIHHLTFSFLLFSPGFCVKLVCIHPIRYSGRISKGQILGKMLPMQRVFPGITSHIHVENCDRSDPTRYLERGKGQKVWKRNGVNSK